MKLENQVILLELSKRLKELGVKQESLWWWFEHMPASVDEQGIQIISDKEHKGIIGFGQHYSAFTVAELGEMLSKVKYDSQGFPSFMIFRNPIGSDWHCCFRNPPLEWVKKGSQEAGRDKNMANALAKMLIYLKEKKLLTPKN